MGRRAKIDYQTRLEIIEKRIKEGISLIQLEITYKIWQTEVKRYIRLYQKFGTEGLKLKGKRNTAYTLSFKNKVVKEYLAGKSKMELSIEYQVSKSVVFNGLNSIIIN